MISKKYKYRVTRNEHGTTIENGNIPKKYMVIAIHSIREVIDTPWFVENRTGDHLGQCIHLSDSGLLSSEYCYGHHVVSGLLETMWYFKKLLNASRYSSTFILEIERGDIPVLVIDAVDIMEIVGVSDTE